MRGNSIHNTAVTAENVIINNSDLKEYSRLKSNVEFRDSVLGEYSYISSGSIVNRTRIGKFTSIGPGTYIGLWDHDTDVTTHSFHLYETSGYFVNGYKNYKRDSIITDVGNDVWVGANVCIQKGVRIGSGAIIGSGSVVTKDVEPYSIIVGNPGRLLRKRFNDNVISMFMKTNWWDFPRVKLKEMVEKGLFGDIDLFVEYIKLGKYEF
jgi:acetyltransferase-like isoleucine patch superfamily enzyme